jgi:histidinol-phosphatase (PHP family)
MKTIDLVSVHGGHSGQFCNHATDSLEAVVQRYIDLNFVWVGITEHSPPPRPELRYRDEADLELSPAELYSRFRDYMGECRRLQEKFQTQIRLFAAIEIETYAGYESFVPKLIADLHPDYIVGSVHFVDGINFDYSAAEYARARQASGSMANLYCRYFDLQFEMIERLQPAVVGHFDLIRLFDPDYPQHLALPQVQERIWRNLTLIKKLGLILDLNLRALVKGAPEPYISRPILLQAKRLGIAVVPGDDSHGVASVGNEMTRGVALLQELGFATQWQKPKLYPW